MSASVRPSIPSEASYRPIDSGPTHSFAALANTLVCIYSGAPNAQALKSRIPWVQHARSRYGTGGLVAVVVADARGSLPDRAFRDESRRQAHEYREFLQFSATVLEGEGLSFALLRTFLRGLALTGPRHVDVEFFGQVAMAAAWAAERARNGGGDGPSSGAIISCVQWLRDVHANRIG